MRLGLDKRGSLWLFTAIAAAVVISLVVFVQSIPLVSQVWDAVDGCSYHGGGGVLDCFKEELPRELFYYCLEKVSKGIELTSSKIWKPV